MCKTSVAGEPHVSFPTKPWKNQSYSPTRETIMKPHLLLPLPPPAETLKEAAALFHLSFPIAVTALLIYSRSVLSMLFLGFLGDLPLAAGSLAIAFANITGYSVLSGLSLGMEPLCSQAFGANQPMLLFLTLHRSVIFLLCSSFPIAVLWFHMSKILLFLRQDPEITSLARSYLLYTLPDLISFSFIHPIRIYLRSQGITRPLTVAAAVSAALHLPVGLLLVGRLRLGAPGVAAASAAANLSFLICLLPYLLRDPAWRAPNSEALSGWGPLARLAAPSCASVCLEWWWYELMILLCGLLPDPKPAVAAMGVLIQTTALLYVFPSSIGLGMGMVAMGFAAGVREQWGRMFTSDGEILRLTAAALPIVGLCELGNCPQTVACGILRGSARPAHAARVNLGAFYLVGTPVAVGLGFGLGLGFVGLWVGLLAAQVCCAGLMLYLVGATNWEAQAQMAQLLTCAGEVKHVLGDLEEGREALLEGEKGEVDCCET
ncbi:Protein DETOXIFICATION 51 [Cocos nucifera]|nr:Protein DETOXIFICATION 51 [Cocos nucifera]